MIDAWLLGVGAAAVAVGLWRWSAAHGSGGPRGVGIVLVALGAALVTLSDLAQDWESELYPSLGRLLSNLCTLTAAYGILVTASELAEERPIRRRRHRRLAEYLGAVLVLLGSFFATTGLPEPVGAFGGLYRTHPSLVVYILVYVGYLAAAVLEMAAVVLRALPASRGPLRTGLALWLAATGFALAYVAGKVFGVAAELGTGRNHEPNCTGAFSGTACTLNVAAPAVSILLLVVSVLTMTLGVRLANAYRARRLVRSLAPLHRAVTEAAPRAGNPGTAGSPLVRTVIEIRDGLVLLDLADRPAAEIAHRLRAGTAPAGAAGAAPEPAPPTDLWSEAEALRAVAAAYQHE